MDGCKPSCGLAPVKRHDVQERAMNGSSKFECVVKNLETGDIGVYHEDPY